MVEWLEPLQLQTIFMVLFAGDPDYFVALAIIIISAMAGYFRNNTLTYIYMLGLFLLMFSEYSTSPILTLISIIGGLAIGLTVSKLWGER